MIGVGRWVLYLPGCHSLKAKRSIMSGLKRRLRTEFQVSVAETDFQDRWRTAELSAALVAPERTVAESILSRLDRRVDSDPRARVVERETALY
ncbi:MAG: DUF503 domain-containing protein [Gemmatimonadota bacterium]